MLNSQSNRREWIFYLVRDLTRHLAPRQHTLRSRDFYPAQLEVARQTLRRDTTEPERREGAGRGREQHQHPEIPAAPVEHDVVAASRCGQHVTLLCRAESSAVAKEHFRGARVPGLPHAVKALRAPQTQARPATAPARRPWAQARREDCRSRDRESRSNRGTAGCRSDERPPAAAGTRSLRQPR